MNVGSAANAAVRAADLHRRGQRPSAVWRQTVLELLEIYEAWQHRGGADAAAALFEDPPPPSGDRLIDAALPAFAEYLAARDGWPAPQWAVEPVRDEAPRHGGRARRGRHAKWSDSDADDLGIDLGMNTDVA